MKLYLWILTAAVTVSLVFPGCARKSSVDTGKLESSFESAEPATKSKVDSAVSDIKSADYAGAMASLQGLAKDAKLTSEQQEAIKDVVEQLKTRVTDVANTTAEDAAKALENMQKSLKK
jgi:flagellin-like hook-associated protein FlgL